MKKHNWKRTMFYVRRELIRWTVTAVGTLAALCGLVFIMENPDCRLMFYIMAGLLVALGIGNLFYGKEETK